MNRPHELDEALNRHYAPEDVSARILHSLRAAGFDPAQLTRDDAALFDEFHGGGRESTRALARAIELAPGTRVLDIGCGIGGPARTLTAECGAVVTGVDLTHEFIAAAVMLSERVGMGGQIEFLQGSALDLPVPDASFDLVWSQNMLMNLPDKPQFAREVARVLKPGGRCAIEAVVAGIEHAGFRPGIDLAIALDVAATECQVPGGYRMLGSVVTSEVFVDRVVRWRHEYPIVSIEDGAGEDDDLGWERLAPAGRYRSPP
jgi:SAM-dependent methyltransferase